MIVDLNRTEKTARFPQDRANLEQPTRHIEPPFLSQVGLLITLGCNISCRHCMVSAGPHRKEEVILTEAISWLHQIASYHNGLVKSIGFTGGEPFFCWEKLQCLANTAKELGLTFTVMTNCFWAESKQIAQDMLRELQPSDISVSTDIYHTEFIPIEYIQRVVEVCEETGIRWDISLAYDPSTLEQTRALVCQILQFAPRESIRTTRVFPSGRGESQADFDHGTAMDNPPSESPCLFASVPYIFPNGDILACVGPVINLPRKNNPLFLGSLRERSLATIFDASQANPILHGLRLWGPRFLHRLVEAHGPKDFLPEGYFTDCPCEGCISLLMRPTISEFLNSIARSMELNHFINHVRRLLLDEETA